MQRVNFGLLCAQSSEVEPSAIGYSKTQFICITGDLNILFNNTSHPDMALNIANVYMKFLFKLFRWQLHTWEASHSKFRSLKITLFKLMSINGHWSKSGVSWINETWESTHSRHVLFFQAITHTNPWERALSCCTLFPILFFWIEYV